MSNVIQHTGGGGTVEAWDPKPNVPFHLAVWDANPLAPAIAPAPSDAGGRGLRLVGELSDTWGTISRDGGKVVWAEFSRPVPSAGEAPVPPLIARLDPPLVVVTTSADGRPAGCLVQFHTQSNAQPLRYAVWLAKTSATCRAAVRSDMFAVHFLSVDDHDLAARFGGPAGSNGQKFADVEWRAGPGDVPLLERCDTRLVLRTVSAVDDGSGHICLVGELQPDHAVEPSELVPLRRSHLPI